MKQKNTVFLSIAIVAVIIVAGGIFWYSQKVQKDIAEISQKEIKETKNVEAQTEENQSDTIDGIKSVQDLIDGEYVFKPANTSDWQIYKNEEAGFEVKIPKNWFCGGTALDPNSLKSIVCLEESQKKNYYSGNYGKGNIIMINFPDKEIINTTSFKENIISHKKEGSKIYKISIDKKENSIMAENTQYANIFDNLGQWNIVKFSPVNRGIFDGFLTTFRFTK